jgi:hypothetical protein
VTAVREHHDKGPHPLALAGAGIEPLAQVFVVELRFFSRGRIVSEHRHLGKGGLLGELEMDVAAEGGVARL